MSEVILVCVCAVSLHTHYLVIASNNGIHSTVSILGAPCPEWQSLLISVAILWQTAQSLPQKLFCSNGHLKHFPDSSIMMFRCHVAI
jgi:hypothetical protein